MVAEAVEQAEARQVAVWAGVTGFFAIVLVAGSTWLILDGSFAVTVSVYLFDSTT